MKDSLFILKFFAFFATVSGLVFTYFGSSILSLLLPCFSCTRVSLTLRKSTEMFVPFLADTSWYVAWYFFAYSCTSYVVISLSEMSDLLPTINVNASSTPLVSLTKSIHLSKLSKLDLADRSTIIRQMSASRIYEGISDRNLYWPAVSHNCNRNVYPSTCMVFVTKSIPTVGWI